MKILIVGMILLGAQAFAADDARDRLADAVKADQAQLETDQQALKLYDLQQAKTKSSNPDVVQDKIDILNAQAKYKTDQKAALAATPAEALPVSK